MNRLALSVRRAAALVTTAALAATNVQAFEAWSAPGSAGFIDESSTSLLQMSGATLQFLPEKTGTATIRFPLYDVFPDPANASPKWLALRYRDNGPDARVVATLYEQRSSSSTITPLGPLWDSDGMASSNSYLVAWRSDCTLALDFLNKTYWIEVTMTRNSLAGSPGLQQVRMDNFSCVPASGLGTESATERR